MPTRRAPRVLPTRLGGHLYSAATERLPLKLAALFFAVVLWVVAGAEEPTEARVPVAFAPLHDTALVLRGPTPVIRAVVAGRRRELLKLYRTPPVVRYTFLGDMPDTVRLHLRPADVDLPAGAAVRVLDVRPREALLTFASRDPQRDSLLRAVVDSVRRDADAAGAARARRRAAGSVAPPVLPVAPDSARADTLPPPPGASPDSVARPDSAAPRAGPAPPADTTRRPPPPLPPGR